MDLFLCCWFFPTVLCICFFVVVVWFLRQNLTLLPRPECSVTIPAHCNLCLLGLSNSHASAPWVARTTGASHHAQLIFFFFFVFLIETGFHHVSKDGLDLLTSSDPLSSASQSAGITGMSHNAWSGSLLIPILQTSKQNRERGGLKAPSLARDGAVLCQLTQVLTRRGMAPGHSGSCL